MVARTVIALKHAAQRGWPRTMICASFEQREHWTGGFGWPLPSLTRKQAEVLRVTASPGGISCAHPRGN